MRSYLLSIVFFSIFINHALAEASSHQSRLRLPKVVVEGEAVPTSGFLDSADITYITAEELEQQQSVTIVDALRRVPGVYVTQNGGIGQKASVSLRGSASGQTSVILDGMHINDVSALNGAVDLAPWIVDDIAEIQVIRGPFSSLYGSDAIGGVVIINTKKGKGRQKIQGKVEAGSYHTYGQVLSAQGQKDFFDYHVTISRLQSMGSPLTPDRLRFQLQGKSDDPLHQEGISTCFGMGQEQAHLSFFSRYLTRRLGFRVHSKDPWRQNLNESFNRLQGHFEGESGKWVHEVGIAHYVSDRMNENPFGQKDGENNGSQTQIDWRQTLAIHEKMEIQIATELAQERFYTHRLGSDSNQSQSSHGGLGGALAYLVSEPLTVSTSARIDKYQDIPLITTYRVGAEYRFENITFKGGIGTGFKAPTLAQRFYKSPNFSGNPNLKPEKSVSWDAGVERSFFQKRLNLSVTLFQNRIRNMISAKDNTHMNLDQAQTQGFEIFAKLQMTKSWRAEFTQTYTQSWDVQTRLKLIRCPQYKTTFQVIGQVAPQWQVSSHILYVGQQADIPLDGGSQRINMPSYTVVGAETSYQLNDQWQIYGRGENLTNHSYENPNGYQQAGFCLYAGVRAQC